MITVFGATGQVGKEVVRQALVLGHPVKAFGRNTELLSSLQLAYPLLELQKGYVFDEADVYQAVCGSTAVISCLGGAFDGKDFTRSKGILQIITQMQKTGVKRIIALGGMGVLNNINGVMLIDSPEYPEQYKPVGAEHVLAYKYLASTDLEWTFIGAPDIIEAPLTAQYITKANFPPDPNLYKVYSGDLAHFMLNELNEKQYIQQRVGISALM